ncbi:MAG: hypothetical protein ACO3HB_06490 [Burkholderiaceae bacterium]
MKALHHILPHAHWQEAPFAQAWAAWRSGWQLKHRWLWQPEHPLLPHEQAQAHAAELHAQWPAWAAWQTQSPEPCAWISPCHWQVDLHHVNMTPLPATELSNATSQALCHALATLCQQDGWQLQWIDRHHWLLKAEGLQDVHTVTPERALHNDLRALMPESSARPALAAALRRLMNEAPMLFYEHAANTAHTAQGHPAINAIWIHGSGGPVAATSQHVIVAQDMAWAALMQQPQAWQQAWQNAAQHWPQWQSCIDQGLPLWLHVGGAQHAHSWQWVAPTRWRQALERLKPARSTHPAVRWLQA